MNDAKMIRVLWLCLSIITLRFDSVFSSFVTGTLVATSKGLVPIEKLKVGDKVLSYDLDVKKPDRKMIEIAVTKIDKHLTDTIFSIRTTKYRCVEASPQQLFLTLRSTYGQATNTLIDFAEAQYITKDYMLVDVNMSCIPIFKINVTELSCTAKQYSEKVVRDKHNKVKSMERQLVNIDVYSIEVEEPHTFLVAEKIYFGEKDNQHLFLTHNGLAELSLGVSLAFDSTPVSASVAGVVVNAFGISLKFGRAGFAVGATAGLGYLAYELLCRNNDNKQPPFYIEQADKDRGSGGYDPKDPKNKKGDRITNTITKVEFFRQIKDQYEYWKDGVYKLKDRVSGLLDGKAYYLQWDNLHNDIEVYSKGKTHLGSLDPKTLNLYKGPVDGRKPF